MTVALDYRNAKTISPEIMQNAFAAIMQRYQGEAWGFLKKKSLRGSFICVSQAGFPTEGRHLAAHAHSASHRAETTPIGGGQQDAAPPSMVPAPAIEPARIRARGKLLAGGERSPRAD
jgi:hypothetical protein